MNHSNDRLSQETAAELLTLAAKLQAHLLNPEGRVDGLLLKNGLQVKFPPHKGYRLTATIAPGADISLIGTAGISTRHGQEIRATQITNRLPQQTLSDQHPATTDYSTLSASGKVQHWLVGHRGKLNGVVLSSGTQVKFPPKVGERLLSRTQVGDDIQVQGFGTRNAYGQVIQATSLTVGRQTVAISPPRPKSHPL